MDREFVLEVAIEARSRVDAEKLERAVAQLKTQLPLVGFSLDSESGQLRLKADSEEELDSAVERLANGTDILVGSPQVAYREAPSRAAEADYTHKKIGPSGQFARLKLLIEPAEELKASFASDIIGGSVPDEYIPGVERGVRSVFASGPLVGFPMAKTRVTLIDGAYHDVDSSPLAFEIAARAAMREAGDKLGIRVLEPFMRLDITCPEDVVGTVIGELNSRRGEIKVQDLRGETSSIEALAPLANLFGYRKALAAVTSSRATLAMAFDHYRAVPNKPPDDIFPSAIGMRA